MNQVGQYTQSPSQSSPAASGLGGAVSEQNGSSLLNTTGQNNLTGFLSSLISQLDQANLAGQNKTPELQNKISELQTILQSLTSGTLTPGATPQPQNGAQVSPSSLSGLNQLVAGDAATLAQLQAGDRSSPLSPSLLENIAGAPSLLSSDGTINIAALEDLQTQLVGNIENLDQLVVTPEQQTALQNVIALMQKNGLNTDTLQDLISQAEITQDPELATLTTHTLSQMSDSAASLIPMANSVNTPNPTSLDQAAATPIAIPNTPGKANAAAGSNLNSVDAQAHTDDAAQDESWRISQDAQKQAPAQAQAKAPKNNAPNMQNLIAAQAQTSQQPNQAQMGQANQTAATATGFGNLTAAMDMGQSDMSGQQFGGQGNSDPILQAALAQQNAPKAESTQGSQFANYMQNSKAPASAKTIENLSLQIQKGLNSQNNVMKIQLTPLEMGQVDIEMRFTDDGAMQAHMVVEKPETLAMLQKDSSALEQSLKDAGLQLDNDSLQFELRQQNAENDNQFANNSANDKNSSGKSNDQMVDAEIAVETYEYIRADGVNIWV